MRVASCRSGACRILQVRTCLRRTSQLPVEGPCRKRAAGRSIHRCGMVVVPFVDYYPVCRQGTDRRIGPCIVNGPVRDRDEGK